VKTRMKPVKAIEDRGCEVWPLSGCLDQADCQAHP
jgi:hypothetical protein